MQGWTGRSEIQCFPGYKINPVINVKGDAAVQRPLQVHHLMQQQRKELSIFKPFASHRPKEEWVLPTLVTGVIFKHLLL